LTEELAMNAEARSGEVVYVSWGGTGRAASVRRAMEHARDTDRGLLYLAILDDSTFGDLDDATLELAKDELAWLLDAQLDLTKSQTSAEELSVRVLVRSGDVADEIVDVVDTLGKTDVLIGAPVPTSIRDAVEALITTVTARTSADVSLVEP
jgi:hypothetical protein